MTRPPEEQDDRDNWFAQVLGEEWRSQGDGTYRFVGDAAARDRSDQEPDAVEELDHPDPSSEPLTREPRQPRELRQPRFPWRRR